MLGDLQEASGGGLRVGVRGGRQSVSKFESHVFQCLVNGTGAAVLSCQFGTMFTEPSAASVRGRVAVAEAGWTKTLRSGAIALLTLVDCESGLVAL